MLVFRFLTLTGGTWLFKELDTRELEVLDTENKCLVPHEVWLLNPNQILHIVFIPSDIASVETWDLNIGFAPSKHFDVRSGKYL